MANWGRGRVRPTPTTPLIAGNTMATVGTDRGGFQPPKPDETACIYAGQGVFPPNSAGFEPGSTPAVASISYGDNYLIKPIILLATYAD